MAGKGFSAQESNWKKQAQNFWQQGKYGRAAELYEQAIAKEPKIISYYWNLGLLLLLQGEEGEAQATWVIAMTESEANDIELLVQIIGKEASRQASLGNEQMAWVLRQNLKEIDLENVNNLLELVQLSVKLQLMAEIEPIWSQITAILSESKGNFDTNLLLQVLQQLLEEQPGKSQTLALATTCVDLVDISSDYAQALTKVLFQRIDFLVQSLNPLVAVKFVELCLKIQPQNIALLANATNLYQNSGRYLESIKYAQEQLKYAQSLVDQIAAYYLLVRGFMKAGGHWQEAQENYQQMQQKMELLIEKGDDVPENHLLNLMITVPFSNYLADTPKNSHEFRSQIGSFCQARLQQKYQKQVNKFKTAHANRERDNLQPPLRIGYISNCFYRHSVGWLVRWLLQQHDKNNFQIYAYSLTKIKDDVQQGIAQSVSQWRDLSLTSHFAAIAECIAEDEIDILVDLDSVTDSRICGVMALQPAPIQVTWLGSDASGIPAIDYFIADPQVLPSSAKDYYAAKIWRLPQSYIAVTGFETGVPTLRREHLNIPDDAVVYLSAQSAYKRNPDTARLQMRILKAVPNSYFCIKGWAEEEAIRNFFTQIAKEEGVATNRLRFLGRDASEMLHRANLSLADVVLDTYPYNGATTTLETLWMAIPLVTQVGEQFAARNSYTMMLNAGISEGIAWTEQEYVEWGIRFGGEAKLRQEVSWKMRQGKQNAPLWNTKSFTQQMEQAYVQMWHKSRGGQQEISAGAPGIKLHIGGKEAHPEWKIFDIESRPEVDFVGNAADLSQFTDNSIQEIYASHVLEHFYYGLGNELILVLKEWYRVLQPGGKLMISVPNLQILCQLYSQAELSVQEKYHLMRIIFGGQTNEYDVHRAGLDFDIIQLYLNQSGFKQYQQVEEFNLFSDCSNLRLFGKLISLNVVAVK